MLFMIGFLRAFARDVRSASGKAVRCGSDSYHRPSTGLLGYFGPHIFGPWHDFSSLIVRVSLAGFETHHIILMMAIAFCDDYLDALEDRLFLDVKLGINQDAMQALQRRIDGAEGCGFSSGHFSRYFASGLLGTLYVDVPDRTRGSTVVTASFAQDAVDLFTGPGQVLVYSYLGEYPGAGPIERPLTCYLVSFMRIQFLLNVSHSWGLRMGDLPDVLSRYSFSELAGMMGRSYVYRLDARDVFRFLGLQIEGISRPPFWHAFRQRRLLPRWKARLEELALERQALLGERGSGVLARVALHDSQK